MSLFVCEISGESLATTKEEIVVTPSGHICIKRLLLQKLIENGNLDPFEQIKERPLSEDQLITLSNSSSSSSTTSTALPPPRLQATSLPNMLQQIQTEYDALVLELFDTRKSLEDTRRELSQALYQNDAAVRVIARISMERDTAKQELEQWNASVGHNAGPANGGVAVADPTTTTTTTTDGGDVDVEDEPRRTKKRRLEEDDDGNDGNTEPLQNDLPEDDVNIMVNTWQTLQPKRKPTLKAAAATAPSPDDLATKYQFIDEKAWHKSTCKGIVHMGGYNDNDKKVDLLVTVGKDKQIVIYDKVEKVIKHTFSYGSGATAAGPVSCVDINSKYVIIGDTKGKVIVYSHINNNTASTIGELQFNSNKDENHVTSSVVDVRLHPDDKHICVATSDGKLNIATIIGKNDTDTSLRHIATFETSGTSSSSSSSSSNNENRKYTCGALHPDGLLYAAGTSTGHIHMWDFKNKVLASTLKDGDNNDAVVTIAFSNNGYHLATSHHNGHNDDGDDDAGVVRFWDLRKQKIMSKLNVIDDLLFNNNSSSTTSSSSSSYVSTISYDPSGKYIVMGGVGNNNLIITTVKEWKVTASIPMIIKKSSSNDDDDDNKKSSSTTTTNDVVSSSSLLSGLYWSNDGTIETCYDNQRTVRFYGLK